MMPVTPESLEVVDRIHQHNKEVAAGLIPADSPPTFIRADWKPNENGLPGWFPPDFKPGQVIIERAGVKRIVGRGDWERAVAHPV